MILVTGANGNLGNAVIEHLLNHVGPEEIAGMVRSLKISEGDKRVTDMLKKGIEIRIGDYSDKESLRIAMKDIDTILLVTSNGPNAFEDHKNVIAVGKENKVKNFFYVGGASKLGAASQHLGALYDAYVSTENVIRESGMNHAIFRNGLYSETIPFFVGDKVLETGIFFPAGDGRSSFATIDNMAEAIAKVISEEISENRTYTLTGQQTYSFKEIAGILSELSGKEIAYLSPEADDFEDVLKNMDLNEDTIRLAVLFAEIIRHHEYEIVADDLTALLGRKPTDLKTFLKKVFVDRP